MRIMESTMKHMGTARSQHSMSSFQPTAMISPLIPFPPPCNPHSCGYRRKPILLLICIKASNGSHCPQDKTQALQVWHMGHNQPPLSSIKVMEQKHGSRAKSLYYTFHARPLFPLVCLMNPTRFCFYFCLIIKHHFLSFPGSL